MSSKAAQLLQEFEALPEEEKQVVMFEFLRRAVPYDSGPIDDGETARSADDLFRASRDSESENL